MSLACSLLLSGSWSEWGPAMTLERILDFVYRSSEFSQMTFLQRMGTLAWMFLDRACSLFHLSELELLKLFHPKSPQEFRLVHFYIFSIFPHLSKSQATLKKIFFLKAKVAFFPRSFRSITASKATDQTV